MPKKEMFSHSTPIIPRGSFQVACEKIWGSFGVVFRSILEIIWGRGSFRVAYRSAKIVDMHTVAEQPDT